MTTNRSARFAVLGALWAGAAACRGSDPRAAEAPNPLVGLQLEAFAFPDAAGQRLEWSPEKGLRSDPGAPRPLDALLIHAFQPDCPACREHARALERVRGATPGETAILGVAHRLGPDEVKAFAADTSAAYPLLLGSGEAWADRWGRGDAMYIVDRRGTIAYAQVGFHPSDVARWQAVMEDLAAGREARFTGPDRDAVAVGERMPEIAMPLVEDGSPARLGVDGQGALVAERGGDRRRFRAAVGFFSRY